MLTLWCRLSEALPPRSIWLKVLSFDFWSCEWSFWARGPIAAATDPSPADFSCQALCSAHQRCDSQADFRSVGRRSPAEDRILPKGAADSHGGGKLHLDCRA